MKHTYLSEVSVNEALANGVITAEEAESLMKKIDTQVSIYNSIKG